jgi:hypothetical protein
VETMREVFDTLQPSPPTKPRKAPSIRQVRCPFACRASVDDSEPRDMNDLSSNRPEEGLPHMHRPFQSLHLPYGSIRLARQTQEYNADTDRTSLPRARSHRSPGPLHLAASSPGRTIWPGTLCGEEVRHHMQNFNHNPTVRCLRMEAEGISNNMVLLGLALKDQKNSRNGIEFGRVDTPLNQRQVSAGVSPFVSHESRGSQPAHAE